MITFGSLFAGIGGMDLGLERAGMTCAWQVEIDDYARRVLAKHWPDVRRWNDIRYFLAGKRLRRRRGEWAVDLIAGGFPCQDISYAGRGAGLAGKRSGLWYEYIRVIRLLRPRYVLVENVSALLVRGLDAVLGTLASLGYDAEWGCIPAAAVGAPHIRDRVFLVAHAKGAEWRPDGRRGPARAGAGGEAEGAAPGGGREDVADAASLGRRAGRPGGIAPSGEVRVAARGDVPDADDAGPQGGHPGLVDASARRPAPAFFGHDAPRPDCPWWATEPDVGRVAHGVPSRVDRLRGLGNAVVPQVAEWIGRRILASAASS